MIYLLVLLLGLTVGSFLNAIIHRLKTGESFLFKRSYCPHCGHKLSWEDLIPVLSFILLKGRCRYCNEKISWQYPLVELTTALSFILVVYSNLSTFPVSQYLVITVIYELVITSFLIVIFVYDFKHFIIPDKVIYPAIGLVFLYRLFKAFKLNTIFSSEIWNLNIQNLTALVIPLLTAVVISSIFLLIFLASKGKWMGFGDIKLVFLMGFLLSYPRVLVALFLAFAIGGIIGIGLIATKKKEWKSKVPFAPFLVVGSFAALLYGEKIINWYLDLMLY